MNKFMQQVKDLIKQRIRKRRKRVHKLCESIVNVPNPNHFLIGTGRKKAKKDQRFYK